MFGKDSLESEFVLILLFKDSKMKGNIIKKYYENNYQIRRNVNTHLGKRVKAILYLTQIRFKYSSVSRRLVRNIIPFYTEEKFLINL